MQDDNDGSNWTDHAIGIAGVIWIVLLGVMIWGMLKAVWTSLQETSSGSTIGMTCGAASKSERTEHDKR
ncbi:hypothetical protein [Paracidovorax valerianellae]|uniref:Uncharacterized protein n=1 Tax=Paracidovorax valerianellae TaxID=187868 RepID=A0A1G6P8V7_9BURK|nr:hypothetical protein [Paracidovorax valerianellae]MDA8444813.1 hypothetical protein [Paracidovorax valerianellae]SDC76519.1 hypothetical protein SAMN05192589_103174 [Paracidovorax valerianellae]